MGYPRALRVPSFIRCDVTHRTYLSVSARNYYSDFNRVAYIEALKRIHEHRNVSNLRENSLKPKWVII